ncbi:UPF0223 protein [Paraliobacillus quinghaiensis]|uniref:UPF0223 protein GCM10011351_02700 n=1 Tax=Paraliobacillus quinghaiensis TaxID=470815 RepID=A0A917TEC9_9BACI|nr:UPF0223 family protein [Paraliobacillus quinghaiensis]GGM20326.1 UPF0223 protein [Paraliobacillus quinghaiensis]
MQYSYPIDDSWSTDEIIKVVNFLSLVEKAHEDGIRRDDLLIAYTKFKQIVPSKSEEKQIGKKFEKETGFSIYQTIKRAQELKQGEKLKIKYK